MKSRYRRMWRRLIMIGGIFVVLVIAGSVVYTLRLKHHYQQLLLARAQGMAAFEAGDYPTALRQIGQYLGRNEHDIEALYHYTQAREYVEEPNRRHVMQAIRLYLRLLDAEPNHPEARRRLLELYRNHGFSTEALATAEMLLAADPDDLDALAAKAETLSHLRRFTEALPLAMRHNELAPFDLEMQGFTLHLMRSRGGGRQVVLAHSEGLLTQHPGDPRFMLLHSFAAALVGDRELARHWALRAAAEPPSDVAFAVRMVRHLNGLELFEESAAVLHRAALELDDAQLTLALVSRLWELNEYEQIVRRASGNSADLMAYRAMALMRLSRRTEAEAVLHALDNSVDAIATSWTDVIRAVFAEPAEPRLVIAACESALYRMPDNAQLHYFLGESYAAFGEIELAIEHWRRAQMAAPAWPAPKLQVARRLALIGRSAEAFDLAQAARRRAPDNLAAEIVLAQAWAAEIFAGNRSDAAGLLRLVEGIHARHPYEPQTLPLHVQLAARSGDANAAKQHVQAALAHVPPLPEQTLIELARLSWEFDLGLEAECFRRSEELHGATYALAYARAIHLLKQDRGAEGLTLLEAARPSPRRMSREWRLAWASYLDHMDDPRARREWMALADDLPEDAEVQWMALNARSVQGEREFRGRALERLGATIGRHGVTWRVARARWLLEGYPNEQKLLDAVALLNEVTRAAPDLVPPRRLLAFCLEQLGNVRGAIEQLVAASHREPESAAILLELARLHQLQGDFMRARQQLDRVTKLPDLAPQHRWSAATLLAQQGENERATALLPHNELESYPDRDAQLLLAWLHRQRNRLDLADAVYRRLLENPDEQIVRSAADFYASLGRGDAAAEALARLEEIELPPAAKQLIHGDFQRRFGTVSLAIEHYRQAVAAAPDHAAAWKQLILTQVMADQADEALLSVERALSVLPNEQSLRHFRGYDSLVRQFTPEPSARPLVMLLLEGPVESAPAVEALLILQDELRKRHSADQVVMRLRQLSDRHPRCLPLHMMLIERYVKMRRVDDAIAVATRTMQLFPSAAEPAEAAAKILATAGRWPEVVHVAGRWRQRTPGHPLPADMLLAAAHLKLDNPAAAARQLEPNLAAAIQSPDRFAEVVLTFVSARLAAGQPQAAMAALSPLLEHAPASAAGLMLSIGSLYDQHGHLAEAESAFRHALRLDPGSSIAMNNLAYAMLGTGGNPAEAQRLVEQAIQIDPRVPNFYDTLAWVQAALGDSAAAVHSIEAAIRLDPTRVAWRVNLAKLLAESGRIDEARAALRQIDRLDGGRAELSDKYRQRLDAARLAVDGAM